MQFENAEGLKKAAQHFLDTIKHHLDDSTIQTLVREGNIVESILTTAKEIHADIAVMGSHSQKWLESVVVGSVTEEVLRQTKIPLFIIPMKKYSY
jgi:nucleotide-binding universal stress UspA family protein